MDDAIETRDEKGGGPRLPNLRPGWFIGTGASFGLLFGTLLKNLALGLAIGAGLGAFVAAIASSKNRT